MSCVSQCRCTVHGGIAVSKAETPKLGASVQPFNFLQHFELCANHSSADVKIEYGTVCSYFIAP